MRVYTVILPLFLFFFNAQLLFAGPKTTGPGAAIGELSSISIKQFIYSSYALDVGLGTSFLGDGTAFFGDFFWDYDNLFPNARDTHLYLGPGLIIQTLTTKRNEKGEKETDRDRFWGPRGVVGVEKYLPENSISFHGEMSLNLFLFPYPTATLGLSVGMRYWI